MHDLPLKLNRMEIEEVGYNPTKLALAIHKQLPANIGIIDAEAIARALDILEVRYQPLTSFEGALLTQRERTDGVILVNSQASPARRRFTVAHELLHFLNDMHVQTNSGFKCRHADISLRNLRTNPGMTRHLRQEAQANRFAVELLAPKYKFNPFLNAVADLQAVVQLSRSLGMSKEATARRFVEVFPDAIAVLFHKNDRLRYFTKHDDIPNFKISKGHQMPMLPQITASSLLTEIEPTDPSEWFWKLDGIQMTAQTLYQQDGYGMTLLNVSGLSDEKEQTPFEDTFERYNRWNS